MKTRSDKILRIVYVIGIIVAVLIVKLLSRMDAVVIKIILEAPFIIAILVFLYKLIQSYSGKRIRSRKGSVTHLNYDNNFEMMYREIRKNHEDKLENARNKVLPLIIFLIILVIAALFILDRNIITFVFLIVPPMFLLLLAITIMFSFFMVIYYWYNKGTSYKTIYKETVVSDIVSNINDRLRYYNNSDDSNDEMLYIYNKAKLDKYPAEYCTVSDVISGPIENNLYLKIAYASFIRKVTGSEFKSEIPMFEGLMSNIMWSKKINGTIKILCNQNRILNANLEGLTKVKMDSNEFENTFNVYSTDSIAAMQVLTSEVMQRMVEFERRLAIPYEVCIEGEQIIMRFFTNSLFEPSILKPAIEKENIRIAYEIINLIIDVTKELNKTISEVEI